MITIGGGQQNRMRAFVKQERIRFEIDSGERDKEKKSSSSWSGFVRDEMAKFFPLITP